MASVQYEVAYTMPGAKAVDTSGKIGVNYVERPETPVMAEVQRIMAAIRATGKCGMFVARWDGNQWYLHLCDPPARVKE